MIYGNLKDEIYMVSNYIKKLEAKIDNYLDDSNVPEQARIDLFVTATSEGIYHGKHWQRSLQNRYKGYNDEI